MNSASLVLTLPVVIPLATAILTLALREHRAAQRTASVTGWTGLLGVAIWLLIEVQDAGAIAVQLGGWPAPYGITFVADRLSALMVLVSAAMGLAVGLYSLAGLSPEREHHGHHTLFHVLLMGVNGSFLTGDLFNLYVWFEVMLIASFVLVTLGGRRGQLEGGLKYMTLNLLGSMIFLASVGFLYSQTGTLNMAHLHVVLDESGGGTLLLTISVLLLIAFGIKAAVFPLFMWLPTSYHTPPTAVSAIFAGLLTKVGVYALIRAFTLIFTFDVGWTHSLLLWLAGLTMASGVLGAMVQGSVRRILSFHIVSQIGYMVMGLALYTLAGLAGAVFYIIHHIVVKTNLFLIGGLIARVCGSAELSRVGGLIRKRPLLAGLFLIPGLSLAGIPPLSGFWAKFAVIKASLEVDAWVIAAVALAVGLWTLFSMMKIWSEAFWKPDPEDERCVPVPMDLASRVLGYGPVIALALVTIAIGLYPAWLADHAAASAVQLLEPDDYLRAVLGEALR
ncbi:Na+/H+ antiporter subunit D [bacterium]|nr:Na+/H+ antiporter subunit D [bacterium]